MRHRRHLLAAALLILLPAAAGAQEATDSLVPAGAEYRFSGAFGGFERWLYGTRYRALWATPVAAPALPVGFSADSVGVRREYRPLDRNLVAITPPSIRQNLLPSVIQGLNPARHPGAAPVVAALAGAVGIAVAPAELVRLTDTTAPGRSPGRLGYLIQSGTAGRSTAEVLDSLRMEGGRHLDARAYLAERLFDTWLGSWDDAPELWRWTRDDDIAQWEPAPRDRERAFAKYDGVLAGLARRSVPGFVNFEGGYQERLGVMPYQQTLDRQLLSPLDWSVWDSVTLAMTAALTDSVIAAAAAHLPPEYRAAGSAPLVEALTARREGLGKAARRLYRLVNQEAAFFGTPGPDTVTVTRHRDGGLELTFANGMRRHYDPGETDAVALYLLGGADQLTLAGPGDAGPLLDVAWHEGLSVVGGRRSGARTFVYGGGPRTGNLRLTLVKDTLPVPEVQDLDLTRPAPVPLHGTDVGPVGWFDVNSDVGVLLGAGVVLTTYRAGFDPYYRKLRIRSGYATAVGNYAIELHGEFHRWRSREAATLDVGLTEIAVLHFFGYGNTTPFTQPVDYYNARQRQLYINPAWHYRMTRRGTISIGPVFKHVRTDTLLDTYISQSQPYGVPEFAQFGVAATATYDSRDAAAFTRHGAHLRLGGSFYPVVFGDGQPFGSLQGSAAAYLTPAWLERATLAMRVSGRLAMGEVPVHEASFLGGSNTVRGYESGRYAGDASAWFNGELRLRVATLPFVVPWQFGVVGIGDVGRVFNLNVGTEDADVWHAGAGGGVWVALPDRSVGWVVTIVGSDQGSALWMNTSFMF